MHKNLRRAAVPQQAQMLAYPKTMPAATRGIIQNENYAFMKPAAAIELTNWFPTQNAIKIRGGSQLWATCGTNPIQSMFPYDSGNASMAHRLFAADASNIYNATLPGTATVVVSGQADGNYSTTQFANQSGNYLLCCNDAGDYIQRYDGMNWTQIVGVVGNPADGTGGSGIWAPPGSGPTTGQNLVAVWKYGNRLFFIEKNSMNAWYLDIGAIQGMLHLIPLAGQCQKGGNLLFGCTWSTASGAGLGDQCVFVTDLGEFIIFEGTNPGDVNNWSKQGCYNMSIPMGKNSFLRVAGDVFVACKDGIVPLSQAVLKDPAAMELATVTTTITPLWRTMVSQRGNLPWSMSKYDVPGALYVTWPGASPGQQTCAVANVVTGAWCTYLGWDARCWAQHLASLFYGDSNGNVVQGEIGGNDQGNPFVCSFVGGWEVFGMPPNMVDWKQGRLTFQSTTHSPIMPQLTAAVDYNYVLPPPPNSMPDAGGLSTWDNGAWDSATWDANVPQISPTLTTYWVSIGALGHSHAPIVQVTVSQGSKPDIQLLGTSGIVERVGLAV